MLTWLSDAIGGVPPAEPLATCDDCAMCKSDPGLPEAIQFRPSTKCCTYLPEVANFLVGAVLADDTVLAAPGRASVEARIAARTAVTPLGLGRTLAEQVSYQTPNMVETFGRSRTLTCPHYLTERGGCGIWRHRPAVCATWFCKHDRGAVAQRFWFRARNAMAVAETAVAKWCVLELELGEQALAALFPPQTGTMRAPVEPDQELGIWGRWTGRELEFYRQCATLAGELTWPRLLAIAGVELELPLQLLAMARADMESDAVPERPRARSLRVLRMTDEVCHAETYHPFNPIALPSSLVDALHRFDGRLLAEVLAEIEADYGLAIDSSLVRKLCDFDLLGG